MVLGGLSHCLYSSMRNQAHQKTKRSDHFSINRSTGNVFTYSVILYVIIHIPVILLQVFEIHHVSHLQRSYPRPPSHSNESELMKTIFDLSLYYWILSFISMYRFMYYLMYYLKKNSNFLTVWYFFVPNAVLESTDQI